MEFPDRFTIAHHIEKLEDDPAYLRWLADFKASKDYEALLHPEAYLAAQILGLTADEAYHLFYTGSWKSLDLEDAYWEAADNSDHQGMAQAAAAVIDQLLDTIE